LYQASTKEREQNSRVNKKVKFIHRKKIFCNDKEYTVPVPIWMVKISPEEGFPIVPLFYDEKYGVRKEIDLII
jgi:hypothetical protein